MIEYAGVGVAMGNAIPELKAVAQLSPAPIPKTVWRAPSRSSCSTADKMGRCGALYIAANTPLAICRS